MALGASGTVLQSGILWQTLRLAGAGLIACILLVKRFT